MAELLEECEDLGGCCEMRDEVEVSAAGHTSESGSGGGEVLVESSGLAIRRPPSAWVRLISPLIAGDEEGEEGEDGAGRFVAAAVVWALSRLQVEFRCGRVR